MTFLSSDLLLVKMKEGGIKNSSKTLSSPILLSIPTRSHEWQIRLVSVLLAVSFEKFVLSLTSAENSLSELLFSTIFKLSRPSFDCHDAKRKPREDCTLRHLLKENPSEPSDFTGDAIGNVYTRRANPRANESSYELII